MEEMIGAPQNEEQNMHDNVCEAETLYDEDRRRFTLRE